MAKYKYGRKSEQVLSEVHFELDLLAREMLSMEIMDIAAICGRRGKGAQEQAFVEGNSKARWGYSKHNVVEPDLSDALDLAPYLYFAIDSLFHVLEHLAKLLSYIGHGFCHFLLKFANLF